MSKVLGLREFLFRHRMSFKRAPLVGADKPKTPKPKMTIQQLADLRRR